MNALFWIVLALLWVIAIGFLVMVLTGFFNSSRQRLVKRTQAKLYRLAKKNGWMLLKDIDITTEHGNAHIDGFLLADKYCYAIHCQYASGVFDGDADDGLWTLVSHWGKKKLTIDNPAKDWAEKTLDIENFLKGADYLESRFVLPITVIPNLTSINPALTKACIERSEYVFKSKYLKRGILSIEDSSKLDDLDPDSKKSLVKVLKRLQNLQAERKQSEAKVQKPSSVR